jgi:hypothetical protein
LKQENANRCRKCLADVGSGWQMSGRCRKCLADGGSVWQMLKVSDRYRKRHAGYGKGESLQMYWYEVVSRCRKRLAEVKIARIWKKEKAADRCRKC